MPFSVKSVDFYNITVEGHVGQGSKLLSVFARVGVNLLAFRAVPVEPAHTQFTLFPDDSARMFEGAQRAGLDLDGPYSGLLIEGDDESGALADIYVMLAQAGVNIYESSGIANINGGYGVVLYLNQDDCEKALEALSG